MNTDKDGEIDGHTSGSDIYTEQQLTERILKCAFAVHNTLGAGFLERVYANALAVEMREQGIAVLLEVAFKIKYKGTIVVDYVADMVVESRVLVELKACAALDAIHFAQVLNYLRASGIQVYR
jgi:GxxExxY protein